MNFVIPKIGLVAFLKYKQYFKYFKYFSTKKFSTAILKQILCQDLELNFMLTDSFGSCFEKSSIFRPQLQKFRKFMMGQGCSGPGVEIFSQYFYDPHPVF